MTLCNKDSVKVSLNFIQRCEYQISSPGMPPPGNGVVQIPIKVNEHCIERSRLVYALARILGLPDEHTRGDRDNYIDIHWDNIERETVRAKKYNISSPMLWAGIESMPYDFTSVTHIGPFEHALDIRKPTLSSKYEGVYFGNHQNLSVIDVMKLRKLYKCPIGEKHHGAVGFHPIHCTFDLPLCGMVNDWTLSGIQWKKRKGPASEEGPQTDHSNGNGWYMFVNGTETFTTARLVSITELSPGDVCFSMYYYIEDNSTSIRISIMESASNNITQSREIKYNEGISWSEARFNLKSTKTWRLLIEADVSNGTVAIDDVMVQYGKCISSEKC
ncbi:meprin A subunit beta-like [Saccostrea cucullata]|uniref:meprin A subunit beta-like n=1 Tax=Saccostrea cuccullata TaxID=36930 RepID=UPI002ED6A3FC